MGASTIEQSAFEYVVPESIVINLLPAALPAWAGQAPRLGASGG